MKNSDIENKSLLQPTMLTKLIVTVFIGVSVSILTQGQGNISTLKCYTCNSEDDPGCFESVAGQRIMDCGLVIADLSSFDFRCMTIKGVKGNEKIAVRRCSTRNECNFQLRPDKSFEWGAAIFPDATCDECVGDFCNDK
ncbi:uncharacterized protein LOC132263727 [Phlebotomus argentipes]|uniref:uncharacterized protein LOC132263727 n=1 Tax=Phlebotomus argentipes TaxID=94469 RepID=UPI002892DF54|nr:uncharacterized protein LOC132263727 [Phlebotomus argentipes]